MSNSSSNAASPAARTAPRPGETLRCLLVNTKFSEYSFWNIREVCEVMNRKYFAAPLGLVTVAALLPQEWEFILIDENVEDLKEEHFQWADLICTTAMLPQQMRTIEFIQKAKASGKPVVVGGPDPTSQPELYKEADFLVLGEGEITIPRFLKDFFAGASGGTYTTKEMADMEESPVPRFDLFKKNVYMQLGMQISRGCPYTCEFCDIIELYGRKPRLKTIEQVLSEMQALYDVGYRGYLDLVDDNLIANKPAMKKILRAMLQWSKEHGFPFFYSVQISINAITDDELMVLLRANDVRMTFIGIETADDALLKAIEKKPNEGRPMVELIHKLYDYGFAVSAGFIVGFDQENSSTADAMIRFIDETGICMAMIGMLYALPTTQFTRRLKKEGRYFDGPQPLTSPFEIDQTTAGLNFVTSRPRKEVLQDFAKVISSTYDAKRYFQRVYYSAVRMKTVKSFTPNFKENIEMIASFLRALGRLGTRRGAAWHFWKLFFKVLFTKPAAMEAAMDLGSMYLHFGKQARFILSLMDEKIKEIDAVGEESVNQKILSPATGIV